MDLANVTERAAVWEKVVRKLRTRGMPPAGVSRRPDQATYDSFATYLETELDRAAAAKPNPGRPVVHRLNRAEYINAIRDLLDLEIIDAESLLPSDPASGYGFDNIGEVLTLSPLLMDRYLSAAKRISGLAIGDPTSRPIIETYVIPDNFEQQDRVSDDLPLGSRGGMAIRHYFPLDAEYVVRIIPRGIGVGTQLEVRLDGTRIKLFESRLEGTRIKLFEVERDPRGERKSYENLEVRFPAKAGMRLVGVTFLKDTLKREGVLSGRRRASSGGGVGLVDIEGPYDPTGPGDTPSRRRIFVCRPTNSNDEAPCAKKILSTLGRRAYRRPVSDGDVQRLLNLYKAGWGNGGFEAGIGLALQGILISPEFLFHVERDPAGVSPGAGYRISDVELASRLSFFLWSSIPDDQLLDLAERGELKDPAVLEQQVRRMLADPRSKALSNFGEQWLQVRNLRLVSPPDPAVFPDFNGNLLEALEQETVLFVESIMREDRSVIDLLSANYTFLNKRLAQHYGVPGVYGSHFRRVTLSDPLRWGVLGKGAILTVTSYATRTAPTLRGKWVLNNILGTPPPPPLPNVPSLKDDDAQTKALSMRERLAQHRADPVCAACHRIMDPLGFALENFDAIGKWRTVNADNTPIDVSGELPDGTKFEGPAGLQEILLSQREQFVNTFIAKLLTYALGRGVEYYDMPAVRKIKHDASASEYRWSSIVVGIVKSLPFQMRGSQES